MTTRLFAKDRRKTSGYLSTVQIDWTAAKLRLEQVRKLAFRLGFLAGVAWAWKRDIEEVKEAPLVREGLVAARVRLGEVEQFSMKERFTFVLFGTKGKAKEAP